MAKNSFIHPVNEVRFGTYKPADVKPALDDALKQSADAEKAILAIKDAEHTYENTIQALNDSTEKLEFVMSIVGHLSSILGGEWDKPKEYASQRCAAYFAKRGLNKKLYLAIKNIESNAKKLGLTPAQIRLVGDYTKGYERSGINLPKDQQQRLKKIQSRLSKLSSMFERNVTKASDAAHLFTKNLGDLAGVDQDQLEQWQQAAKEKNLDGYYIQYNAPNYDVIMRRCSVQKTRRKFHKISGSRAPQNERLIYETLSLRKEIAKILGYKNFVDYVVEDRMAKNSKAIAEFNDQLYKTFKPAMQADGTRLRDFVRKLEQNPKYELEATDVMGGIPLYYGQKMGADILGMDEGIIREYLPLEQVLHAMFDTFNKLYGVTIKQSSEPVPQKDTQTYHIYDEKGRHLSTVWCDWFARKGKHAGAWCNTFYEAPRNGRVDEPHLGTVVANFTPPTKTKPSLLSVRDAETVWHEFGHFMHATFSNTELREQGGFHCKWDFVEAPSQILENWVWTKEILSKMTKHYKTGKPMPTPMIDKLLAAQSYWAAERVMWTLSFSTIDQLLHTVYDPAKHAGLFDYYHKVKSKFFVAKVPDYDKTLCTFTHIFAGGYYGAYYSYQWAEVIEADLFSRFQKEGVLNPKTGRDYRDKILARGDEVDPDVLIRDFLGRDANPKALLKRNGL